MYSWDCPYVYCTRKIKNAAKKAGHEMHIETQGTIGIENELTPEQIKKKQIS